MGTNEGRYSGEIRSSDITQAIEVKQGSNGTIVNFRVETTFGRDGVDFARFSAFGEVADYIANELREGDFIDVDYRVKSRVYEGQNGAREILELRAHGVQLSDGSGGATNQGRGGGQRGGQQQRGGYQQHPQGQQQQRGGYQQQRSGGSRPPAQRPYNDRQAPPPPPQQQARYSRRDENFDQQPPPQQQRQQAPRQQGGYDDRAPAGRQSAPHNDPDDGRGHPPDMFDPEKGALPPRQPPPPMPQDQYVPPDSPPLEPGETDDIPF